MTYFTARPISRGHISTRRSLSILRQKLAERQQRRRERQEYRELLKMDDHILRDIGLSRDQIRRAANASLDQDVRLVRDIAA